MKLLKQRCDPQKCAFFFSKIGLGNLFLKIKVFPENMGIGLEKKTKKIFFLILGGPYGPPKTWGPPKNWKICQL